MIRVLFIAALGVLSSAIASRQTYASEVVRRRASTHPYSTGDVHQKGAYTSPIWYAPR